MSAPRASACGCRSTVGAAARAAGRPIAALTASAARALASTGRSAAPRTVVERGMVVTPGKDVVSPGRRRRGRRGCLRPLGNLVRGRHGPTPIVAPMTGRLLRMSTLFVRTLRDDPNDAEVPSHRLLVRAGYIRRAAPGIYTWLPLGLRVLRKIEDIIREEMDDDRRPGAVVPGAAAQGALRGDRPLDRLRPQHLPAPGPQGRRLPARPHARGDVHPRGEGPLLLLQGPAALDLPDPDEVPRRGASPRRRCCAAASSS